MCTHTQALLAEGCIRLETMACTPRSNVTWKFLQDPTQTAALFRGHYSGSMLSSREDWMTCFSHSCSAEDEGPIYSVVRTKYTQYSQKCGAPRNSIGYVRIVKGLRRSSFRIL